MLDPNEKVYAATVMIDFELLEQWLDLPKHMRIKAVAQPSPLLRASQYAAVAYIVDESGQYLPEYPLAGEPVPLVAQYETGDKGLPVLKRFSYCYASEAPPIEIPDSLPRHPAQLASAWDVIPKNARPPKTHYRRAGHESDQSTPALGLPNRIRCEDLGDS
jgi:hypothetical protein